MRPLGVVVLTPLRNDDLRLFEAVEDLAIQEFVSPLPLKLSL